MVSRQPARRPNRVQPRAAGTVRTLAGNALLAHSEFVAADPHRRGLAWALAAWFPAGWVIGGVALAFGRSWLDLAVTLALILVLVVNYAPTLFMQAWPVPRPPVALWWWLAGVMVVASWPLYVSRTGPGAAFSGRGQAVCAAYFVTAALGWAAWTHRGPAYWSSKTVAASGRWNTIRDAIGLGSDARRTSVKDRGEFTEWRVLIGAESGRTSEWYVNGAGNLARRVSGHLHLPDRQVIAKFGRHPGEVVIVIFRGDPWGRTFEHPVLADPALAITPASILDPIPLGVDPLTGAEFGVQLATEADGAQHTIIVGKSGSGKTTVVDTLIERVTSCPDARLVLIDVGKGRLVRRWGHLAQATAVRDPDGSLTSAVDGLGRIVEAARIREDQAPDGFTPTETEPALVVVIEEVSALIGDEVESRFKAQALDALGHVMALATKGRSAYVTLVLISQGAVKAQLGDLVVLRNMMNKVILRLTGTSEQTALLGKGWETTIPVSMVGSPCTGATLVVDQDMRWGHGRAYLLDPKVIPSLIEAKLRWRQGHGDEPRGQGQDQDQGHGRVRLALASGAEWVKAKATGDPGFARVRPQAQPGVWPDRYPALDSVSEGHLFAATRRRADRELRYIEWQVWDDLPGVGRVRHDLIERRAKVVVEVDSQAHHGDEVARARDARRDAALHRLGYVVVRLSWRQVVMTPDEALDEVVSVISERIAPAELARRAPLLVPPLTERAAGTLARLRAEGPELPDAGPLGHYPVGQVQRAVPGVKADRPRRAVVAELVDRGYLAPVVERKGVGGRQQSYIPGGKHLRFEVAQVA